MGVPEDLYAKLDAKELERLVTEQIGETQHLEYKSTAGYGQPKTPGDYRAEKISKPLGGFANSLSGGVLLYGIKVDEKDRPIEIERPVKGLIEAIKSVASDRL